jgi:hypothetical protein
MRFEILALVRMSVLVCPVRAVYICRYIFSLHMQGSMFLRHIRMNPEVHPEDPHGYNYPCVK